MREILFRGKCLETGEWVFGFLERRPSPIQMQGYGGPWYIYVPPRDPDDNGGFYNINPETVGQYTGITDRNGKKIFEGDILHDGHNYHVAYDADVAGFVAVSVKEPHARYAIHQSIAQRLQVIGNIFDNPELLTAEQTIVRYYAHKGTEVEIKSHGTQDKN